MPWTARAAALALALGASGCWNHVCIQQPDTTAGYCYEEYDSIFSYLQGSSDDWTPDGGDLSSCDVDKLGTTCEEEGYQYQCGDYWYRWPCEG